MKTCVFAGTFDPFTNGHEYIVNKCLEMFDKVIVAIGVNVDKTPLFTEQERINAIRKVYQDNARVEVLTYSGMLVDFMKEKGVKITVRGFRNQDDYKYETTMAHYNQDMYPRQNWFLLIYMHPDISYLLHYHSIFLLSLLLLP